MTRPVAMFLVLFAFISPLAAAPSLSCLLVSIEKYTIAPLDYAENDVARFAQNLMSRYGFTTTSCIDVAGSADSTRKSIEDAIEDWCKKLRGGDTAVLYLAGHGVKDDAGKLYLAMKDFDRKNFDSAAVPLEWIRDQFGKSSASNKMLLIDTCFAGTSKSIDFEQANATEMSNAFADLNNVVTIASCQGNEKSWLWGDAKHSLFTYWLIEAFKGHADLNGDTVVTCYEIVSYVKENVPWIASSVLNQQQHPVVLNEAAGANFKLPLRAIDLDRLIDDVAEQIDLQMRQMKRMQAENSQEKIVIGVPEFTTGENQVFDPAYGTLPRSVADKLREKLVARSRRGGYGVLNENAMREALQSKNITPSDLGTEKTREMKVGKDNIPHLVDGRMTMLNKAWLTLRVHLLATQNKSEVCKSGGVAQLSPSEVATSGVSGKFAIAQIAQPDSFDIRRAPPQSNTILKPEPGVGLVDPERVAAVERMREAATQPHPLAPATNPVVAPATNSTTAQFDVWIEARRAGSNGGYTKRPFEFRGNDCYCPISKGEEYQINFRAGHLPNELAKSDIFVRVLVDGLNTLSQRQMTVSKGAYAETAEYAAGGGDYVIAPRVTLDEARPWVIKDGSRQTFCIPGFFDEKQNSSTLRRFRVVDADESVAARKNYTEQLGLITVAFYRGVKPPPYVGSRSLTGTGMGPEERARLEIYKGGNVPGDLLAVYNIRYLTPDAIKKLPKP